MRLLYYKPPLILSRVLPGVERFEAYFKIYGYGVSPIDRTGIIKFPVRTHSLFPLPQMREFTKTYEELCNERAAELLARDAPLYVLWSGGIDSTCVLVSLLKVASAAHREKITVLLSRDSVVEYPLFYQKHVAGLTRKPASAAYDLLGTPSIIVSGEHNDQLFGSDVIAGAIKKHGHDAVFGPYNRRLFMAGLQYLGSDAKFYVDLFERLAEGAPIRLPTNFDRMWWINFALKWQHVYMRVLSYAKRDLSPEWARDYYAPFYGTEEFQLWSMNNPRKKIRGGWNSYKWPAKEVIYDFTKDADYRDNKIKVASLQFLIALKYGAHFIDDSFKMRPRLSDAELYEEENNCV